jgi:nucleotide-binding universal stress UspA family protein
MSNAVAPARAAFRLSHILAPVAYALPEGLAYAPSDEVAARQVAERAARLKEWLSARDAPATRRVVVEEDPGRAIVDFAAANPCDLIIMPTHGYGALQRLVLGSVTAEVLRSAPCPVWTGAHYDSAAPSDFRKVLCALDLEPRSRAVLDWAAGFARAYGAKLEIVYAISMSAVYCGGVYFDPEWHIDVAHQARAAIDELLQKAGVEAEIDIELGDVPHAIIARARDIAADLLVIGRGPHCYSIVRHAPGAVVGV